MSRWEKRLAKARNNPKDVTFGELCHLPHHFGFEVFEGKGSHSIVKLPGTPIKLTIPRHNPLKRYYVERALAAIEEARFFECQEEN